MRAVALGDYFPLTKAFWGAAPRCQQAYTVGLLTLYPKFKNPTPRSDKWEEPTVRNQDQAEFNKNNQASQTTCWHSRVSTHILIKFTNPTPRLLKGEKPLNSVEKRPNSTNYW